ncbi:HET-domain-containing protein, partial [Thozetella sp. PMI_491]
IRILRVWPGPDDSVAGELQTVCLSSDACPAFTALSYTWGTGTETQEVMLSDRRLPVRAAVYSFLMGVCGTSQVGPVERDTWFWIDSICINQGDLDEKSQQIPLMETIFRQSTRTIVWLGDGSSETDEAIDFLQVLAGEESGLAEAFQKGGSRGMPPRLGDKGKWVRLQSLLDHPWWRRVWTLQEFLIPPKVDFLCGTKAFSRSLMNVACYAIWLCNPPETLIKGSAWFESWRRRRVYHWYRDPSHLDRIGLVALMAYTGNFEVTDPRDRLYGLLGLVSDEDMSMVGDPLYTYTASTIYTALVRAFVDKKQSLDIICFAPLFRSRGATFGEEQDMPSWAPDWSNRRDLSVIPLLVSQSGRAHIGNLRPPGDFEPEERTVLYDATRGSVPRVSWSAECREMTCRGIFLDYVDGLGDLGVGKYPHKGDETIRKLVQSTAVGIKQAGRRPSGASGMTSPLPEATGSPSELLDAVVRSVTVGSEDRYLSSKAPVATFRRDMQELSLLDLDQLDKNDTPTVFLGFLQWYGYNKTLRIGDFTLGDLCERRDICLGSSEAWGLDPYEEGFSYRVRDVTTKHTMDRRLLTTDRGYVGMAPRRTRKGDLICVLYGCSVPVILHKVSQEGDREAYELVGECYLDGFMSGQAMSLAAEERDFTI